MSALGDHLASSRAEVGPCSASAAICSEMSSIVDVAGPRAFCWNQRRLGSAAVQRYVVLAEPRHRAVVDDLAVLVAPGRVDDLADRDLACASRVMMRSTRRVASVR